MKRDIWRIDESEHLGHDKEIYECGHCGRKYTYSEGLDANGMCEDCAAYIISINEYIEDDYIYEGFNNIDNLFEGKREGKYRH